MRYFPLFFLVCLTPVIHAAEPKFDPDAAARTIAPFVDEHTLVVMRVDPSQIDADAFVKLLDLLPANDEARKVAIATGKAWLAEYRKKGGREIYITYGSTEFPQPPCLLTPIAESPPERKDLSELLKMIYADEETQWANINGFLCVGPKASLARIKNRKSAPRPEIARAFASCGESIAQAILIPSEQSRKIFEEVSPNLPKELGAGSVTTLTRDMKWAAFSIGAAPRVPVRFVIQTSGETASTRIVKIIEQGIAAIEKELPQGDDDPEVVAIRRLFNSFVEWSKPTVTGKDRDQLVIAQELQLIIPNVAQFLKEAQPAAARSISQNNLKQIILACHNHASAFADRFPANIQDKSGKPLLSWRVAILPYIEQNELYQKFKLDEPWDSEHNQKLIPLMPKIYASPLQDAKLKDRTTYLAPLGKGLVWDDPKGQKITMIPDGTSNTILIVESDDEHAVVWTRPDDITIDPKNPLKGLMGHYKAGFMVGMCDGSVRLVSKDYSAIYAMFTRDGGEVLPQK